MPRFRAPLLLLVSLLAALSVFALLDGTGVLSWVRSYVAPISPYEHETLFFFGNGCRQCAHVDDFIGRYGVAGKVAFTRLEVFDHPENAIILADRVQRCGLDEKYVGVPFLWESATGRCAIGYPDIINFFQETMNNR